MKYYQRLRDTRDDAELNQTEVAEILGMNQTQYSRYELGKQELPMHHFRTLAQFYNVSLDYLAGLIPTPKPLYPNKKNALPVASGKSVQIGDIGSHNKIDIKQ